MAAINDVPRVEKQRDAAAMLRITARQLRSHESAPWWLAEMRNDAGYDVVAIARAQCLHDRDVGGALPKEESDQLKAQKIRAAAGRETWKEQKERLDVEERERRKARELGDMLPAAVYAEFIREWLSMVRESVENISFEISRHAPTKLKPLLYSNDEKKPSKLQSLIARKLEKLEQWLHDGETETKTSA